MAGEITRELVLERSSDVAVPKGLEWLRTGIARGLGVLYTLNLEHKPAADTVRITVEGFLGALLADGQVWDQQRDAPRIVEAFRRLALRDQFPRPGHLLAALPPPALTITERTDLVVMAQRKERNEQESRQRLAQPACAGVEATVRVDWRTGIAKLRAAMSDVELRKHQLRQQHAGELIAQVKE